MMEVLKCDGTAACLREVLKISVKISLSSSAQSLSTRPGMFSGPVAFRGLIVESALFTLAADRHRAWSWGGWSFLWACVICCFEPCKEAVEVVEQRDVVVAGL